MPVHRRPKEAWGRGGLLAAALALVASAGCWDLSIPTVPPNPPPPSLTVLAPKAGDVISLTAEVSVQADSVDGVSSVTLLCGPLDGGARQAYAWGSPPFVALVDFSVCQGLTVPNPDAGSPMLQLSVQAVTTAGADAGENLRVFLDATGPAISVVYPPTAQPKSPFVVLVTPTDPQHPLSSFPVVLLAGAPADRITSLPNPDGGPPTYQAFFNSTPGIGIDNYDGGQPVPIEVLTDTEDVVRLTVDATGLNGNTTAIDLSVGLSRLVWDRYIPGQPAASSPINWAAEPVAFGSGLNGGLVLPLATSTGGGATAQWIPGVLSAADGTFYGFDVATIGGLDAGYLARGLNAQGQTLFFQFTGKTSNLLLAPPPPAAGPVVTGTLPVALPNPPLTSVTGGDGGPDLLCLQDTAQVCSAAPPEALVCVTPQLTPVTALATGKVFGGPDAGVVAGAGGFYLSPNVAVCGASWNLVDLTQGAISFGPVFDPNGLLRACAVSQIGRLLAVGDGTFVVQLVSSCDVTGTTEYPILRVGSGPANGQSAILGTYTAPLGTPRLVQREVVGVLADGRVVTLTNSPPNTTFELWSLYPSSLNDAGVTSIDTPDVTSPIAGLYDSADATEDSVVARSVYSGADGTFAVLLSGAPLGVGVLAFGPELSPWWLYLYPRITSTGNARLVSASTVGDVYLIDEFNNRAASLRVRPPTQSSVQTLSNLGYSTNPAVDTKGTAVAPNVPTYSGGTPSLRGVTGAASGSEPQLQQR